MLTRRKMLLASSSLPIIGAGLLPHGAFSQVAGPIPNRVSDYKYFIRTLDGHYLTAANGGGLGAIAGLPDIVVALHSDATSVSTWETFSWMWVQPQNDYSAGTFALRTVNGNYVTAVNGGGMGGPNESTCPFHTDATHGSAWEEFTVVPVSRPEGTVALRTVNGNYVTAVNGGGIGGDNDTPIHTDAVQIRAWETWVLSLGPLLNNP